MRTKIFGFALMLSLAAFLGACEGGGGGGTTTTPAATGEPTDTGAATPAATTPAATTPEATTPAATTTPSPTTTP